ncbi:MAG TPA: DUF883 family protein [Usitatibacter sp.]|nr:DUF883 family protein [Usitatibacter sp.]
MRSNTSTPTPIDRDLQNVVADTQELLKTMENEGGAQLDAARERAKSTIESARRTLGELQQSVQDSARIAVQTTDGYVRNNPWQAVGISAAVGAVVGFLVARR